MNEVLYWQCENPGEFLQVNIVELFEKENQRWNDNMEPRYCAKNTRLILAHIWQLTKDLGDLRYGQCLSLLLYLVENYAEHPSVLIDMMKISYLYGDYEISRELAIRALKYTKKSDLKNSGNEYIALLDENKDEHSLDIIGMVVGELKAEGSLSEEVYEKILHVFSEPLRVWRAYDVPKCMEEGSYETIKRILDLCFEYQAYETCLRLMGVLFIAGKEPQEHFMETLFFAAKVAYENGYEEIARQCFVFVDEETKQKCWNDDSGKYQDILSKETKMIVPVKAYQTEQLIKQMVEKGEMRLYTDEEVDDYLDNEMQAALKQQKKERKQREKNMQMIQEQYQALISKTTEESIDEIQGLISQLGDADAKCALASILNRRLGELYMECGQMEEALNCFKTAYQCEMGRYDAELMKDFSLVAEKQGKKQEASCYLFRAELLSNK